MKLITKADNLQIIRKNSYSILKNLHDFGDPRKRAALLQHKSSTGYYLVECLENLAKCFHECFDGITDDYVRAKSTILCQRMDKLVIFVRENTVSSNHHKNAPVAKVLTSHTELFNRIKESQIQVDFTDATIQLWSSAILAAVAIWGNSI
jgi:hypothetical protein